MSGSPQFVDISVFQPENIDWVAYKKWSEQWDGISRVSLRSSYGNGYIDQHFQKYRDGARSAGVSQIIFYHYAYPQYNNPIVEADWQRKVVGNIGPNDVIMLDYEENTSQANANWAYLWLARQEANYGKAPTIYASDAFVRSKLQDSRLAHFPLTLAYWQYNPEERPQCPPPWQKYTYLQYTDKAVNIPGINAPVDANVYLGEPQMLSIQEAANYFDQVDDQHWKCRTTGFIIQAGILLFYRTIDIAHAIGKYNGLSMFGLPKSNEIQLKQNCVVQRFERAVVVWDPQNQLDRVPGGDGPIFLLHIDPLYTQADAQTKQIQQLLSQITGLNGKVELGLKQVQQLTAEVNSHQSDPLAEEAKQALLALKPLVDKLVVV